MRCGRSVGRWAECGVGLECLLRFEQERDGFGKIKVQMLAESFQLPEERGHTVVEVAAPDFDGAQFFFGFDYGASGAEHGIFLERVRVAEGGEFGGKEFLFCLIECTSAFAEFGFPMGASVVLDPGPDAADFITDFIEAVMGS